MFRKSFLSFWYLFNSGQPSAGYLRIVSSLYSLLLAPLPPEIIRTATKDVQVVEPKSFEVNVGSTVLTISGNNLTLSCVAEGFPPPSVQWSKDGSALGSDGSDLRLQPLYIKDSGVYTCMASSPLQGLSDAISTNLTVVGWFLIKA